MSAAGTIWRGIIAWREPAAGMLWEQLERYCPQLSVTYASLESLHKRLRAPGYYQFLYISPFDWRDIPPRARKTFAGNIILLVLGPEVTERSELVNIQNSVFLTQSLPVAEAIDCLIECQRCLVAGRSLAECVDYSDDRLTFTGDETCLSKIVQHPYATETKPSFSGKGGISSQALSTQRMQVDVREQSGVNFGTIHASGDVVIGEKNVYVDRPGVGNFNLVNDRVGIPESLYESLCETLLKCGPFDSNSKLRAIFVNSSISLWQDDLPETSSRKERVQMTVDFLYRRHNQRGECALVLFLRVLRESTNPLDSCHDRLNQLIAKL